MKSKCRAFTHVSLKENLFMGKNEGRAFKYNFELPKDVYGEEFE